MGIRNKLMAHGRDMDEAVLVHADIHKRAEGRDVGDRALQHHAWGKVRDLMHAFFKGGGLKLRARIAAGLIQLGDDIAHSWDTEGFIGEIGGIQLV